MLVRWLDCPGQDPWELPSVAFASSTARKWCCISLLCTIGVVLASNGVGDSFEQLFWALSGHDFFASLTGMKKHCMLCLSVDNLFYIDKST